ncbi:MAG: beta-ketoacyl-[acyl-carrier-protein] synthase II [Saprospirales bacterium]|nr:MAG: beta-ketoacyl-[acyl-carrier-protein] synthase II [Saprospirales bacterium]
MIMRRVVITGIGVLTPLGNNPADFLNGLQKGISGAGPITYFDAEPFKTRFACELKDFNVNDHMDRKEARKQDPFSQYAMIVADQAISDSGIDLEKIDPFMSGVIWGSGIGGLKSLEKEIEDFARGSGTPRYNPFMIPKMISDIAPGHISIKYNFRGINYGTVSACASANHAMSNAFDYIRLGKADIIICGGSEAAITRTGLGGFSSMKALSERNDDPATASRPFDRDRDGFVLGEGAAGFIFEDYEHAKKRGAKIYGEVIGSGMTADAYHITAPHPDGHGAAHVMKTALKEAKINPEEVDYINVHGTSTPLGDVAEIKAIENVFGVNAEGINISSTKSMTGHLLGAAGAVEALACLMAMEHNFVPPTINNFNLDPEINPRLNLTLNEAQERKVNVILSNTFGFGGHNSSLVIKKI